MARSAEDQIGVPLEDTDLGEQTQPLAAEPVEAPPEAPARPEGLPDNFTDVGALAASYNELRGKMRDDAEQRKQLEQRLAELEQAQQPRQQQDGADAREYWENLYEQDPVEFSAQMARAQAAQAIQEYQQQQFATQRPNQDAQYELIAQGAAAMLRDKYADWESYKGKVAEQFEKDPNLMSQTEAMSLQGAANAYDRAYRLAKMEEVEYALANGLPLTAYDPANPQTPGAALPQPTPAQQPQPMLSQSDLARLTKLREQTQTGGNGRLDTPDPNDDWLARMKNAHAGQSWSSLRT